MHVINEYTFGLQVLHSLPSILSIVQQYDSTHLIKNYNGPEILIDQVGCGCSTLLVICVYNEVT